MEWIDVADQLPEDGEIVLIFDPPRRVLAQYVPGHGRADAPWNLMDLMREPRYLPKDRVLLWARLPAHPYDSRITEESPIELIPDTCNLKPASGASDA
jgi:hypothetical protein